MNGEMQNQPILTARGIVNRFGSQEVHDHLDLAVLPGEILGIAGGSGSGKSVLLKTLTGLHQPTEGEILLDGKPIAEIDRGEKAALFGIMFQRGALLSSLSVAQNIMLPLREYTDLPVDEQESIAAMKLELAGLSADSGGKSPAELSGGMIKRVALARALALDPRILFLDEPTSDLDPLTASGIDSLIQRLNRSLGLTVVIITHDLTTLLTVCHRVGVLVDKKIVIDNVEGLLQSEHPWIRDFLHGPRAQGPWRRGGKIMEADRHYFVEGLFVIGLSVAAAFFFIWLGSSGQRDDVLYRIYFSESVSGLGLGEPVKFQGVDVGTVKAMVVDPDNPRRVRVEVKLRKDTPVKTDTRASLKLKGITGVIFVELDGGSAKAKSLLAATPAGQVPEIPSEKSNLATFLDQLPQVIEKFSAIENKANRAVTDVGELTSKLKENPSLLLRRPKEKPASEKPPPRPAGHP